MRLNRKKWLSLVADLGCIICLMPAEIHHTYWNRKGKRDDRYVIPLCPRHHRIGGEGALAFHRGRKSFEGEYGTEECLYEKSIAKLKCKIGDFKLEFKA